MNNKTMRKPTHVLALLIFVAALWAIPTSAQGSGEMVAFLNSAGQVVVSSGDGSYRWIATNPGEIVAQPFGFAWASDGRTLLIGVEAGGVVSLRAADVASQSAAEFAQVSAPLISVSPDRRYAFHGQGGGYGLTDLQTGGALALPLAADSSGGVALWSDSAPLVAYWGSQGNAVLAVVNAQTGESALLDSGRAAPVLPLAWRPGNAQILFRSAGSVYAADVRCLLSGCGANPLGSAVDLLPAGVTDVAVDSSNAYFQSDTVIGAVSLNCTANCPAAAALAAADAGAGGVAIGGGLLVYTSNGGAVSAVDLGCLGGACQPLVLANGATAGAVSSGGRYVVIAQGGTLSALDLATGSAVYLADAGTRLEQMVWN